MVFSSVLGDSSDLEISQQGGGLCWLVRPAMWENCVNE